jgi:hypothetical protein
MARQPRIGSSRLQEGGQLATHKQDFNAHVEGGGFRHTADMIDMNPSLSQFSAGNVQETLELIEGFASSVGVGFVSIGNQTDDGYATGSYNVTSTKTFREALLDAFDDERLQNGGYILILNGTYTLTNTVNIPPGITIIGEPSGSIIVSQTTNASLFLFESGSRFSTIGGDTGSGQIETFSSPLDASGLEELILVDNLDGYNSGAPTMVTTPMVQMETGSRVRISNVKFIGRVNDGAINPSTGRDKTLRAIGTTTGSSKATSLSVSNCFFDGMQTGIRFTPDAGNIDTLILRNNRARIFGTEGTSLTNVADNCFVNMSLCNFIADNNYIVTIDNGSDNISTCFAITSLGGGSDDVRISVTNTQGGPSSGNTTTAKNVLYDTVTTIDYKAVITNNNWGSSVNNSWYVTVGQGGSSSNLTGDFTGPNALDLVLNSSYSYPTDVYILPGSYTVTANGNSSYNLIGVDLPGTNTYPILILNLTSPPTDEISNSIFNCGQRIKNLEFQVSSSWHSIRPGGTIGGVKNLEIKNCKFTDVGISIDNNYSSSLPNMIDINNCYLYQSGTYSDNISLLIPSMDNVFLRNCTLTGYGYAGLIGDDGTISYSNIVQGNIVIDSCLFNQIGFTIDDASPLGTEAYLVINEATGSVTIRNNQFAVSSTSVVNVGVASVPSTTRTNADFESYINIISDIINIENNYFNLPYQTYDVSSTNYVLPGLFLTPRSTLNIKNSSFYNCLCQIGGGALAASGLGVSVDSCYFLVNTTDYRAATVLDIDVDPNASNIFAKKISLTNNSFYSRPATTAPNLAYHGNNGTYTTVGVVQIFSDDVPVFVKNNVMDAELPTLGTDTVVAGILVNNKDVGNTRLSACQIDGNDLYVINNFTSGDSTEAAATLYVDCTNLQILGNKVEMNNVAGIGGSNQISCLYVITNQNATAATPSKAIVTGNDFSRRNRSTGAAVSLTSFIRISALSEPGLVTNNVFSDDTTDGTTEDLVSDDSSSWSSYNNINEYYTITTNGDMGMFGVSNDASGDLWFPVIGDDNGPSVQSYISVDLNAVQRVGFNYNSGDLRTVFKWHINLNGIVPWGANIAEVSVPIDTTANPATLDDVTLLVRAGGSSDQDTSNITTAGDTLTVTSSTLRMGSSNENYVLLEAILQSGGNLTVFTTDALTIKYKL